MTSGASDLVPGILARGRWTEDQVRAVFLAEPARPAAWYAEVDREWAALVAREPHVYDGPIVSLRDYKSTPERLDLSLARTSYRFSATTHANPEHWLARYGANALAMGLAASLGLTLASGGVLLGRRSARVHRGVGKWHPVAGHMDPTRDLDANGFPAPFRTMREEAFEEIGLRADEMSGLVLVALQVHRTAGKPELLFSASTPLTLADLLRRHPGARDAHEADALLEVTPARRAAFLKGELGPYTDFARGIVQILVPPA